MTDDFSPEDLQRAVDLHRDVLDYFDGLDRSDFTDEELEDERAFSDLLRRHLDGQEAALRARTRGEPGQG